MEVKSVFWTVEWEFVVPLKVYTCCVDTVSIKRPRLEIANFKGKHEVSKRNCSVKGLTFEFTTVHFIPQNLTKVFPNLVYLEIRKCGLKEISAADLAGLENLEALWIYDNKLKALPVDLFRNTPKLREVKLSGNLIDKFDVNILEPIKGTIEVFDILGNPGINEYFPRDDIDIDAFIGRLKALTTSKQKTATDELIVQRLGSLFDTGKHSDLTIKVRDKKYRVHKCILASQSSVFDEMFSDYLEDAEEAANKIINLRQEVAEEFLRYFYGKAALTEANAADLLLLAVKFDVPDLELQCTAIVSKTINPHNALQVYNRAARDSLKELQRSAFDAVKRIHPEIADYLYDKPEVVNATIEAKNEFQAKKIKLDKK